MDAVSAEFVRAATMALLRVKYGAENVDFIDDSLSGFVYKIGDDVKYVTLQMFEHEDRSFYCNDETFSGEDNVMTFHPYGIRMFKVSKVKPILSNNKHLATRLGNGDIKIPFEPLRGVVREILFDIEK
jgi:hypothetical protein